MPSDKADATPPEFYIVEVTDEEGSYFVVCEPTVVIRAGEGWGGISSREIEQYIEAHKVRAAPLPGRPYRVINHYGAGNRPK